MSQDRVFSVIGDPNVHQNINKTNCRANPLMKSAQVVACGRMELLVPSLDKVRAASNICVLSCLTNFLTMSESASSVSHRIDPVLQEFRSALAAACSSNPARIYMVAPPMYRSSPVWYREGLPEIMTMFSQVMPEVVYYFYIDRWSSASQLVHLLLERFYQIVLSWLSII